MFALYTDTSANLPSKLLKSRGIHCIPFTFLVDDVPRTCLETEEFDYAAYYREIRGGMKVTTSQINPQAFTEAFTGALEQGLDVLYIGMSSGISGSYASACMAREELQKAYPDRQIVLIDTRAASLGEGIFVLRAHDCLKKGMSLSETAALLQRHISRMCQVFTVDDLIHLRRTGRCSGISALVGTALRIKPVLIGNTEGKIEVSQKKRGRHQALRKIAQMYDALVVHAEKQIVGIAAADCAQDVSYLKALLMEKNPPRHILTVEYEPVTGSHVGPGALALFFEGEDGARGRLEAL